MSSAPMIEYLDSRTPAVNLARTEGTIENRMYEKTLPSQFDSQDVIKPPP